MLFNSYEFIFLYLPVVFFGFFWIARTSHRLAALFLTVASFFFYGWWNPKFVLLLAASIAFNYWMGYQIGHARRTPRAKPLLALAITVNLTLLGIFKYANFFISGANDLFGGAVPLTDIILPLGISFFTFTQIAFLVDVYYGIAREYNAIHYALFVSYFPHLIAGPVLHHKQMMPQFALPDTYRISAENVAVGLTIFTIGLGKKVILGDYLGDYANPVFDGARDGVDPKLIAAWAGTLAYSLQLYFDFSGYSDMAIGLSRLFGIRMPLNFNSPYKAHNIVEFWRRWHMTLSQFLRDYLYISLGGNRLGKLRRYINLMITMVLGGLWHGANWTFVLWGALHGGYLVINHFWHALRARLGLPGGAPTRVGRVISVGLTFLAVTVGWALFRAENLEAAVRVLRGMSGMNGISLPVELAERMGPVAGAVGWTNVVFQGAFEHLGLPGIPGFLAITGAGLAIALLMPNTQEILARYQPAWDKPSREERVAFQLTWKTGALVGTLFGFSLTAIARTREFLYFQF